jgi:hypothetical protein
MNWGKGLFIAFVSFAAFIATLVTVCVRQEIGLVSPDYYAQELAFQDQIDRTDNTSRLPEVPIISVSNDSLNVRCSYFPKLENAVLKLTRASSAKYDASFVVDAHQNATIANYSVGYLPRGRYKGSLLWTMDGKEYYVETLLDL